MTPTSVTVNLGRDPSDEQLLTRTLAGDLRSFETLMRRHNRRVFRAARAVVSDDAEAEDVMQETYVLAYAALPQLPRRAKFSTWVARIAVNEGIARARRTRLRLLARRSEPPRSLPPPAPELAPERVAFDAALMRAIDALPDGLRRAFVLREVEALGTAETAEILGLSEVAVKVRVLRARGLLRDAVSRDLSSLYAPRPDRDDRVVAGTLERMAERFLESATALAAG